MKSLQTAVLVAAMLIYGVVFAQTELTSPSEYQANLYGYTKFDACYDSAPVSEGNYARWVEPVGDKDQFNMTARQTRLGLNFSSRNTEGMKSSGRLEIDFYGGGAENKNLPMMRHAFMNLEWPESNFSILAGQTSDVISPLVPSTVNYPVAWWAGDIGYRRPQLRVSKGFDMASDTQLLFQLAATRSIGGEDSGLPCFQGRTAFSIPLLTNKPVSLGVSGHIGKEEADLDTWSANLDLALPIARWLTFTGELWTGENLDGHLGGIGQGIRYIDSDGDGQKESPVGEIASTGGWVSMQLSPFKRWGFNLGGSIDDPDDADLNDGDRSRNTSFFGNVLYDLNEVAQVGFEISHWDTKYKNQGDRGSFRVQTAFSYKLR